MKNKFICRIYSPSRHFQVPLSVIALAGGLAQVAARFAPESCRSDLLYRREFIDVMVSGGYPAPDVVVGLFSKNCVTLPVE